MISSPFACAWVGRCVFGRVVCFLRQVTRRGKARYGVHKGKMQIHGWTSAHLVARDNTPQPVIASDRPGSERAGHFDAELEVRHYVGRRAERVEILRAVECCGWL